MMSTTLALNVSFPFMTVTSLVINKESCLYSSMQDSIVLVLDERIEKRLLIIEAHKMFLEDL